MKLTDVVFTDIQGVERKIELNGFYNVACLEMLYRMPDKCINLAIVDPPYGGRGKDFENCYSSRFEKYIKPEIKAERRGGKTNGWENYDIGDRVATWDYAPPPEYFEQLFRVSKNVCVWGGNYFELSPTRCFLVWRKLTISESFSMAMCEYCWTSFSGNAKWIELAPQGTSKEKRWHPTSKTIALYTWILNLFAKPGDIVLDTHVGSASSLIACRRAGYDYLGFEIDETYFEKATERIEREKQQITIWEATGLI